MSKQTDLINVTDAITVSGSNVDVTGTITSDGLTVDNGVNSSIRIAGNGNNAVNTEYATLEFYNNDPSTAGPNAAASIKAISAQGTGSGAHMVFGTTTGSEADGTSALERMRIDSSGRVTMPYQPAFNAYKSEVSNTSYGAGNIVSADMASTKYNVGGHYNTSNGRFTAPISGLYLFWCSLFNNSAAVARLRCDINGGAGAWGQGQSAPSSDWAITGVVKLNAGDYVHLTNVYAGATIFHDINHSSWGGYLIG